MSSYINELEIQCQRKGFWLWDHMKINAAKYRGQLVEPPPYLNNIEARTEWRPSPDADADEVSRVLADRHHSRGDSHPPECVFQSSGKSAAIARRSKSTLTNKNSGTSLASTNMLMLMRFLQSLLYLPHRMYHPPFQLGWKSKYLLSPGSCHKLWSD